MIRCTWGAALVLLCAPVWAAEDKPVAPSPLAQTGPRPKPVEAPSGEAIEESIRRGVNFLLARQNKNGSWGSARNTKGLNITAPVPGAHHAFRSAE